MRPSAPIPMTYEMLTMLLTRVGTKRWKEETPSYISPRARKQHLQHLMGTVTCHERRLSSQAHLSGPAPYRRVDGGAQTLGPSDESNSRRHVNDDIRRPPPHPRVPQLPAAVRTHTSAVRRSGETSWSPQG